MNPRLALASLLLIVVAAGCANSAPTPTPAGLTKPSASSAAAADQASSASADAEEPLATGPIPGNNVDAPLPADAPPTVTHLAPLPSCGAEIIFEPDPEISPLPTAPRSPTPAGANDQAANCLIWAWENGKAGQLAISAVSDEQDEIYTLYRLPGDGTVDVLTRVKSHPDEVVTWTDATCKELSVQDGDQITPAECSPETPLN